MTIDTTPRASGTASLAEHAPSPTRTQHSPSRAAAWIVAVVFAAVVGALNALAWQRLHPPVDAPVVAPWASGMAYNAFGRWDSPLERRMPDVDSIRHDLSLLAPMTPRLRTYSAAELPDLPRLAREQGMSVALGVWLDGRRDNNEREISAAIDAARSHANVQRVIAGNETQLHRTIAPRELYAALDRLRTRTKVPVSTAEPWHVWLAQPELARHVDFITVHLLPYWEGQPVDAALDHAFARLREVQQRFPGKRVVIGEIGWPSGGDTVGDAVASPANQAIFVREFLARAPREGALDYYLMEAVDQPWKRRTEGRVGAHWGLLDAERRVKFTFDGSIDGDAFWAGKATVSSLLGFTVALAALLAWPHLRLRARALLALVAQAVATGATVLLTLPMFDYLRGVDVIALVLLVPAVALMATLVLVHVVEFAEMFFWRQHLRARHAPKPWPDAGSQAPFVSVHLACSNEPPSMVIATIDSLLALDWPAFEVIVVDNNTRDDTCWRPVQAHVQAWIAHNPDRANRLRFVHLERWPGFKAGALEVARAAMDARTEWVAVVDADYVVDASWLRRLAGWFALDDVAVVQSPQAHRDWQSARLARMMNWEYDGFFRIGMHHRHERNAAIQHGTMTIVRASALREAGGWSAASVCEDSELGLRLLEHGWRVLYVDHVFGTGLVPQDFGAYARQRRRWATGAMQILGTHAAALAGRSRLSLAQRYHFVAGWLPWVGDAMHLVFTLAAIAWSLAMLVAPGSFAPPVATFAAPIVGWFVARALLVPLLYRRLVPCAVADIIGAAVAGMALSHSVARGVFAGLFRRAHRFDVTRKAASGVTTSPRLGHDMPRDAVREERALAFALLACGGALVVAAGGGVDRTLAAWLVVLAMQALPYAMALACERIGRATPQRRPQGTPTQVATAGD